MRLLLGLLLLLAAGAAAHHDGLFPSEGYIGAEDVPGFFAVFAPEVTFGGTVLFSTIAHTEGFSASEAGDCATACRNTSGCGWFNYCNAQAGCTFGNRTAVYRECLLMAANCTLIPRVIERGKEAGLASIAGFPIRTRVLPALPGYVVRQAQGVVGGDFPCNQSIVPGICAFSAAINAGAACSNSLADQCNSVMVYENGTDGCSSQVAVLKTANLAPSNSFMAPTTYVLEKVDGAPTGKFLLKAESSLIQPTAAELEAAAAAANGTSGSNNSWVGCIVANGNAIMAGDLVGSVDGVPTAEGCCRECRKRSPRCNVWHWCNQTGGCRYEDLSTLIDLQDKQCELRYQFTAEPSTGGPPYVLVEGPEAAGFTAGAPLVVAPPQDLEGYTLYNGAGLFGQPGYACNGSLAPDLEECVLAMAPPQMGNFCTADPACAAVIYKPGGLLGGNVTLGVFRRTEGANTSLMVANPSAAVYVKDATPSSSSGGSSSSGLSAGAIAGIAVGGAVVAVVAGAGAWVLLRRRRQRGGGARAVTPAAAPKSNGGLAQPDQQPAQHPSDAGGKISGLGLQEGSFRGVLGVGSAGSSQHLLPLHSFGSSGAAGPPSGLPIQHQALPGGPGGGTIAGGTTIVGAVERTATRFNAAAARPPPASPFVALRQSRMASCAAAAAAGIARHSGGASLPSAALGSGAEGRPARPVSQAELSPEQSGASGELAELMRHRAAEEAAASVPASSARLGGGPASGSTAPTSGSGSASLGASSGSTPSQYLSLAALPPSLQAWLIPPSAVEYQRRANGEVVELGKGASGRVIRAVYNGEVVAAKEVEVGRAVESQEAFLTEAQRMQALRHPQLVAFYGVCLDGPIGILLLELCEGRDLGSVLRLRGGDGQRLFGWRRHGCRVAWEVATALNYLHSKGVVHMDVKSGNVLLTYRGAAKLSDVGLSRLQTKTYLSDLPSVVGTFSWVAPEVLMGGRCTQSVDIYSFSVLLWEIITGGQPVRGHLRQPLVPEECPQEAADLMAECGSLDPTARPTAQQVMLRLQAMMEGRHGPAAQQPATAE